MKIKELFYPTKAAGAAQLRTSRGIMLAQGAIAAVMFSLGTGNFLAGYLTYLGATPALAAQIAAIPTLGCVLQMVAPFLFERLRHRKLVIVVLCFAFRFSMGFTVFAPFLFPLKEAQLRFVFVLYLFSFLAAGFVTPALNQWILQLAPTKGRGRYFAVKDIVANVANAGVAFVMARQLDTFTTKGQPLTGYLVVYGFCIAFSVVDAVLMCGMYEPPNPAAKQMRLQDVLAPLRSKIFRPVLLYNVLWYFASYFSGSFLSIYQLTHLGLSHTFITTAGIVGMVAGMLGTWVWGRVADRSYWNVAVLCTGGYRWCVTWGGF